MRILNKPPALKCRGLLFSILFTGWSGLSLVLAIRPFSVFAGAFAVIIEAHEEFSRLTLSEAVREDAAGQFEVGCFMGNSDDERAGAAERGRLAASVTSVESVSFVGSVLDVDSAVGFNRGGNSVDKVAAGRVVSLEYGFEGGSTEAVALSFCEELCGDFCRRKGNLIGLEVLAQAATADAVLASEIEVVVDDGEEVRKPFLHKDCRGRCETLLEFLDGRTEAREVALCGAFAGRAVLHFDFDAAVSEESRIDFIEVVASPVVHGGGDSLEMVAVKAQLGRGICREFEAAVVGFGVGRTELEHLEFGIHLRRGREGGENRFPVSEDSRVGHGP